MKRALQFALITALLLGTAFADKKSDYDAAQAAANAGKLDDAVRLFCNLAKEDPKFDGGNGSAQQNCNIYRQTVGVENALNEGRYNDAVHAFNSGDFATAEQKFKQIHSGAHLQEARDYINNKIPAAKAQGAVAAVEQKFNDGVNAYKNNDFSTASSDFRQVTGGAHAQDAQGYLSKIQQYQQALQQGDSAKNKKDYPSALAAYQQAQGIKADGPGDLADKITLVQTMMASAHQAPSTQPKPVQPTVAAVVQNSGPKLDVQKLLREAQADAKRGQTGKARGIYTEILAQGPNATAQSALQALPQDTTQKAGAEADRMLAKGIGEFYSGQFEDSDSSIAIYLYANGSKAALAHFYRGVSELTRYYLNGEPADKKLLSKAQDDFRDAKKDGNFKAPGDMVSPKIMKVFDQTS